jgi:hypothetical protein
MPFHVRFKTVATILAFLIATIALPALAQVKITDTGNVEIGKSPGKSNLAVTGTISGYGTVPIGAIIDWWRPSGSALQLPDNFAICDGQTINDPDSPFNGQQVPNLQGQFIQGVTTTANIGSSGGSAQANVDFTVQLPATTGAIPTSAPPAGADQNPGLIQGGDPNTGYRFDLVYQGTGSSKWNDGQHVHTLGGTAPGNATVGIVPPWYGLLKIVRIK